MCGIAGTIDYSGIHTDRASTEKMLSMITYRGPNECGIYSSRYASLGNVRLSIIDLAGGQQPLCDETSRYWIVLNGEIFNYIELRKDLEARGRKFKTTSDTEVLVQLYAEYGTNCLSMLNGQFAVAIWDKQKEELFLARDRVGIRPLFYNFSDGILTFGSEIKCILSQDRIKREFRPECLEQVYTFWTTLTPNTVFKDIYELSPGHFMIFNRSGIKIERYWRLSFDYVDNDISLNDAKE
ncbi:MAG: asparagine synthetase B, partial [Bacteroidales bacterium]|nr:asparagine synthetase B [Bacteroidales bacterium]